MSTTNKILTADRNLWKTANSAAAGVLVDAADYYLAFYEAARAAKKTILLSGWQFDRGVPLLRGDDAPPGAEVRLLKFLDQLCEQKPDLEIYILAWDFHVAFALEREWMQSLYFQWATNERLHFRFDDAGPSQASHHQKFAVVDRSVSFLGGIDLCEARWDDRRHLSENPLRLSRGEPVKPYHDVQAYFAGCDVADTLRALFLDRWARSEGSPMELAPCENPSPGAYRPRGAFPLSSDEVAFSRTDPRGPGDTVREVETLFVDAIMAAERLVYIETQYFSSGTICDALIERMRAAGRTRLEVVVVLNVKPEALKEEVVVGLRQARVLERLTGAAAETGHALGIYDTLCEGEGRERASTYIHSKLLMVDDRFLSVGSANLTNRSMGVDTELNASWEEPPGGDSPGKLSEEIRSLRVSLLAEHTGRLGEPDLEQELGRSEGLVARLDDLTRIDDGRLKAHVVASPREKQLMDVVDPEALPFDPANPDYGAGSGGTTDEEDQSSRSLFVGGVAALWEKLKRS